jgi:outer membrane protein assembly factor BamB
VGEDILVGAPRDYSNISEAGAAYLFNGSSGRLQATFQSPTPVSFEDFGASVAAVGNMVAIGAPRDPGASVGLGTVYLFNATTGSLVASVRSPDAADGDHFGYALAPLGGNFLVGAPGPPFSSQPGPQEGVYLFDGRNGSLLWSYRRPASASGEKFGAAVAAVKDKVLVGAYLNSTLAAEAGTAYLFDISMGAPIVISNPAPADFDSFGEAVAGFGDDFLVGAAFDNIGAENDGAVYLFNGTTVRLEATLVDPTPMAHELFGFPIVTAGGKVIVGAASEDSTARDAGTVYVFGANVTTDGPSTDWSYFAFVGAAAGGGALAAVAAYLLLQRGRRKRRDRT